MVVIMLILLVGALFIYAGLQKTSPIEILKGALKTNA